MKRKQPENVNMTSQIGGYGTKGAKSLYYREFNNLKKKHNIQITSKKWIGTNTNYWKKKLNQIQIQIMINEVEEIRKKNEDMKQKSNRDKLFQLNMIMSNLASNEIQKLIEGTKKEINIEIPNNLVLENVMKMLKKLDDNKYVMLVVDKFYTLNLKNITRFIQNIDNLMYSDETISKISCSDAELYHVIHKVGNITIKKLEPTSKRKNVEGSKFKYILKFPINLKKYQIANNEDEYFNFDFSLNCFTFCLKMSGIDENIYMSIQETIKSTFLPKSKINDICDKYNLYVIVKQLGGKKCLSHYGNKELKPIEIGLIDDHYFIIERTNYTKDYLKSLLGIEVKQINDKTENMTSFNLIKYLIENKNDYLIPFADTKKNFNNVIKYIDDVKNLFINENDIKLNEFKPKLDDDYVNIYFDCETTTEGEHNVYLIRCADIEKEFIGENCSYNMLYYLSSHYKKVKLIAHNISYDFRFIFNNLSQINLIEKGKRILSGSAKFYYSKIGYMDIKIQDSYSLIPMTLRDFSKCFNLQEEKEFLPYDIYTRNNVIRRYLHINEFKKYKNFNEFLNNCKKWNCINNYLVDIIKYSSMYCYIDCMLLKNGYETFKKYINEITELNIDNYISCASISNAYLEKEGVYKGVYKVKGIVREYIQKAVVGGRVMTRDNMKWYIRKSIQDFDAVSLYPTAMTRLGGFINGKPKILKTNEYSIIKNYDSYIIDVKILKVGKRRHFPLMSFINEKSNTRDFTNDITGKILTLGKIALEDLIKFQGIQFEILGGIYYDEGRNCKLKDVIKHLFDERTKMKKNNNPIQNVYKLLLNSSYGKTLLKPFETNNKYMNYEKAINYCYKNFQHIQSFSKLSGERIVQIKKYNILDEHFNNVICGVEVLEMSKRIMNEVICLSEDLNINIYYQDTDSIHIDEDKIKLLSDEYNKLYNKMLIGSDLGQFHNDFQSDIIKKNIKSVESIFLGKKSYIDKLVGLNENDVIVNDYHIRCKGVSNDAIKHFDNDVMKTYEKLFNGEEITFDLTLNGDKKIFDYKKDYTITNKFSFYRKLCFK
jgi:hypothetical protein